MEKQKFEAVLKKSVVMYNMLTGNRMTEREGSAFIEIFDLVEAYNGTPDSAVETFDVLSHIEPDKLTPVDIPTFIGRTVDDIINNDAGAVVVSPEGGEPVPKEEFTKPSSEVVKQPAARPKSWLDRQLSGIRIETLKKSYFKPTNSDEQSAASDDPDKEADIDAAWQRRDEEQAQERERIGHDLREQQAREHANRIVKTRERDSHPVGYDWQICALCRQGARENSIIQCYKSEPTPEEFYELYRLYDDQTHWVFVNRWNQGAQRWDKHLDQYLEAHGQAVRNLRGTLRPRPVTAPETKELRGRDVTQPPLSDPWEEPEKPWRIRYYSDVMKAVTFTYVDKKPTGAEMAHFHHTKCLAVSQAKPKEA